MLDVEHLTVLFGSFRAVDDVGLRIRSGEAVALAGENGAGKSTLVRCIAGELAPTSGRIFFAGERIDSNPRAAARCGVAVVWQDLALCDNLDVAANLLLGGETPGLLLSESRFHAAAAELLDELGIPIRDTTLKVSSLSAGQRQLLAVARAMRRRPSLLIVDEPTAALGVKESAQVERLIAGLHEQGTSVLLVSHDVNQMFRLADRIAIVRHGKLVVDLDAKTSDHDDVVAVITGQQTDASARRQLSRLHGLADRLATADPSSSLDLILSTLSAALGSACICIHLVEGQSLRLAAEIGLPPALGVRWTELPLGASGGPAGVAAASEETVVEDDLGASHDWAELASHAQASGFGSCWATPVIGSDGLIGVITLFHRGIGATARDELDLVTLYAGFVASAVERERLLREVTGRNRVLETIQEMLETLAGPIPLTQSLELVLHALCQGLQADEVGLLSQDPSSEPAQHWASVDAAGARLVPSQQLLEVAKKGIGAGRRDGKARKLEGPTGDYVVVVFPTPGGSGALVARWLTHAVPADGLGLMEDAANSLRLAYERRESERAREEAAALRRSQGLQRDFLSRLSHELRTPLTAIRGYASSLMQADVTWDGESEQRFLSRIGAESARLNRLVDDLLDFSAIESSTLRLQRDWCDLRLVLDAAVAVVAPSSPAAVTTSCSPDLPVAWVDHDRLEQVFVNLLDNALRHNPPGTRVWVDAACDGPGGIVVSVRDDGSGVPPELEASLFQLRQRRLGATAGAGLGLSIAKGIIDAHGGRIELEHTDRGTQFSIHLPVDQADQADLHERETVDAGL
jgi:signal transduction histidine kinase/ABC-type multidrug transport system ATPase subunit